MNNPKCALIILDGWGIGDKSKSDGIYNANTPFVDSLFNKYPHSTLTTFGNKVGLPEGQMGNSEVGHLNIGAGRIVYQQLLKIDRSIENGEFEKNKEFLKAIQKAKEGNKRVHLAGLVSDGGVHASINHLKHICSILKKEDIEVFLHCFLDGRDTDPHSGIKYIQEIENLFEGTNVKIATVIGRYYAMDRDQRWERTALAYKLMVNGEGEKYSIASNGIKESYENGISDEFLKPMIIEEEGVLQEDDIFLFTNFRTDRGRQLTRVLTQENIPEHEMAIVPLEFYTMTEYDETFKNINVLFGTDNIKNSLGEYLSNQGKSQIRAAETEKYPHVTFFFSGGEEKEFNGENRILINSPKVATYDLQPEMSAPELTNALLEKFEDAKTDFFCINFANTDMVGHTGVYNAILKAAETVDSCVNKLVKKGLEKGYSFIIIADHGNADFVINKDGSPNTAHSLNPVPCIFIHENIGLGNVKEGILADVAPTILKMMQLDQPKEMTGNALF